MGFEATGNVKKMMTPSALALLSLLATSPENAHASLGKIPNMHPNPFEQSQEQSYTVETAIEELTMYMQGLKKIQDMLSKKDLDSSSRGLQMKIQEIYNTMIVYWTILLNAQKHGTQVTNLDRDMKKIQRTINSLPHMSLLCEQLGMVCTN